MANTDDFNLTVSVGSKNFTIDGMLVMAELALNGGSEPNNQQIIAVVRKCLEPADQAATITDAEALAIGLRVSMRLQHLGKALAP